MIPTIFAIAAATCATVADFQAKFPQDSITPLTAKQFYWAEGLWTMSPATSTALPAADKGWQILTTDGGLIAFSKGECLINPPIPMPMPPAKFRALLDQVENGSGVSL